jgi:meiosis arrest female protein 1
VIGEGEARVVVLAQPAQIRRFTSDLLRVLKAQANKQAYVGELPELFAKCLGREFDPTEYGLNEVADLVSRVPKNTVVLAPPLGEDATPQQNTVLALPKREQTLEEVERTRFFASEVRYGIKKWSMVLHTVKPLY